MAKRHNKISRLEQQQKRDSLNKDFSRRSVKKNYDDEGTLFFKDLIKFLDDNDFLNKPPSEIYLGPKERFNFLELTDQPQYKLFLENTAGFLKVHSHVDTNIFTQKARRRRSSRIIPGQKLYYLDNRITLDRAKSMAIAYFDRNFSKRLLKNLRFSSTSLDNLILLDFLRKIRYIDEEVGRQSKGETGLVEDTAQSTEKSIIKSASKDVLKQITRSFQENSSDVEIDTISTLIGNVDFLELIIENRIPFFTTEEPDLSRKLSNSLLELSHKKGFRKAGNPKANLNAVVPANEFAKKMGPIFSQLDEEGFKTLQSKVDELNARCIKTARGKDWGITTVKRTMDRWQKLKEEQEKKQSSKTPKPE
jgi:hypothetical protein